MLTWNSNRASRSSLPTLAIAWCLYGLLAVAVTWPLITHLSEQAAGHIGNDTWNHLWGFWWVKDELIRHHQFPIETNLINHPFGGSLYFIDLANALLSIPLQLAFDLVSAYNLVILFQLTLNGFGAFLLANHLVRNPYAAFAAGVIYGFSPHLMAQTHNGISETLNAGFLPIYIMFFLKMVHESPKKNAVFAGLFAFLTTLFNWYYGLFAILFSAIYFFVQLVLQRRRLLAKPFLSRLLLQIATYTALIIPFLLLFRATLSADDALVGRDPEFVWQTLLHHNMTDAMIFFHPGQFYSPDLKTLFGEDLIIVAYLGYVAMGLALLATIFYRTREVRIWIGITGLFFAFALGPYLYFNGAYTEVAGKWIPLPFLLFFKAAPLFSRISHPFRFVVMVQLGLGVLSAFAIKGMFARQGRGGVAAATTLICLLIVGEYAFLSPAKLPLATSPAAIPAFYERLGDDNDHYAVLDLPVGVPNLRRAVYTYYQTAHRKAVPYSLNDPFPSVLRESLLMRYMVNLEFAYAERLPPLIPDFELLMSVEALKADGYRYVVVHDDLFTMDAQRERVHTVLSLLIGGPQRYPDDNLVVYRLR